MHNIVSLNDLVTELTQRIAHLTLSLVDTKTETKMLKTDTEDLKKEMSKVKEELKKLEESREGKWTEYGDWSECSAECGGGTRNRTRSCTHPGPATGGANCEGDMMNRLKRAIWTNAQLMADGRVGQLGPNVLYHVEELELKRETGPAQTPL